MADKHVVNGEPIEFKKDNLYEMVCCDCNLQHDVYVHPNGVTYWYRNDYATKKRRKKERKRKRK